MFNIGDSVTTTVHMIGGRSDEVTGTVLKLDMSRKTPGKVLGYVVDASATGYGKLSVPVKDARSVE